MVDQFEASGFVLQQSDYQDLEIYRKQNVVLVALAKNKNSKKAFRQSANHLDLSIIRELSNLVDEVEESSHFKTIILTSAHKVTFSRGAKIEQLLDYTPEQCCEFIEEAQNLVLKLQRTSLPVIAAINGLTLGGGLELALGCDYRLVSSRENVMFGFPEASLGIIPGMGGTYNLAQTIGRDRAYEIIANAESDISVEKARGMNLIDESVAPDSLILRALDLAQGDAVKKTDWEIEDSRVRQADIAKEIESFLQGRDVNIDPLKKVAPLSEALLTFLFERMSGLSYLDALKYEKEIIGHLHKTYDCREGLRALTEERNPRFQGK